MIKKKHLNITIDNETIKDMITENINISGTINEILKHRKHHIKTLSKLLEKIEKIDLNLSSNKVYHGTHLIIEIKTVKPIIKETLEYLKCESVRKTPRVKN